MCVFLFQLLHDLGCAVFAGHDVEAFTHPLLDDDGRDRSDTHELAFPLVLRGVALLFQASEELVAEFLCVFLEQTVEIAVVLTFDAALIT